MNIMSCQVGVDVSQATLDVSLDGSKPFRRSNTISGCQAIANEVPNGCTVHLESSGGYERLLCRTLVAAGVEVRIHDPLRVRRMAQALTGKAKTDEIDAKSLCLVGPLLDSRAPQQPQKESLTDISRAIEELNTAAAEFLVRARAAELDAIAQQAYVQAAQGLKEQAKALEKEFQKRVAVSAWGQRYKLALTIPGVGEKLARACVCELPEDIQRYSSAQIASYAGLAPMDNSSGKRVGRTKLGRGNVRLKGAFYMPAVSILRRQAWAKDLYARLKAKGRAHQQAIVAVMRRILIRVVAVLKRGSPWKDEPLRA